MTTDLLVDGTESDAESGADKRTDPEDSRSVEATISAIHEKGDRIKRREVEQVLRELEPTDDSADERREAAEELADAIVDRLLAVPVGSLREAAADDRATVDTAIELFDPEFGPADRRGRASDGEHVGVNDGN
jgi:glutamyl-tRNA reductase